MGDDQEVDLEVVEDDLVGVLEVVELLKINKLLIKNILLTNNSACWQYVQYKPFLLEKSKTVYRNVISRARYREIPMAAAIKVCRSDRE